MTLKRGSLHKDSNTHFDSAHRRHYQYTEITETEQLGDDKGRKTRKKMKGGQSEAVRKVPHMNLWYFASTISYILRKAKAFYNECCCDAYDDQKQKVRKVEVTLVDPYFSMPAFPCTSFANCM